MTGPTGSFDNTAGGDLSGTYPDPTVIALQGTSVSNMAPTAGSILSFNGTQWQPMATDSLFWKVTGNANTNASTNFLGTTDANDLIFKTNSTERMRTLASNGYVGIGTAAPVYPLHVLANSNSNKYAIYGEGRQTSIGTTYNDVGVAGYGSGQNSFSGYGVGVIGTGNQPSSSIAIGVLAGLSSGGVSTIPSDVDAALYVDANNLGYAGIFMNGLSCFNDEYPSEVVDINGDVAFRGVALTLSAGNNNNIDINTLGTNKNSYFQVTAVAGSVITGFNGLSNGRILILYNSSAFPFTLANNSASSTVGNRIITGTGANFIIPAGAGVTLMYGVTSPNWFIVSDSKAGSNTGWTTLGNAGTNSGVNFIGTTDNIGFRTRTNNTERMVVDSLGNVGIGIGTVNLTYPTAKLEIASQGYTSADLLLRNAVTDAGYAPRITIEHARGTLAVPIAVQNGDFLGSLWWAPYDGSTYRIGTTAGINAYVDSTVSIGYIPTRIDFYTNSGIAMSVTHLGNIGIGTTAPTAMLSVNGTANNTTGAWGVFSDRRIKTVKGDFTDGLNVIRQIHTVKYEYNANAPFKGNGEQIGVIAQELEKVAPYMVSQKESGKFKDLREVNNQAYVFLLINSIKEQQQMIDKLREQNEEFKKRLDALEKK
jgi:hypothetical protein